MLKKNVKNYPLNIIKELDNNWAILTAGSKEIGFNCLTVSWGGIGELWGKNVAYVFVRKSRYTHDFLDQSDSVTLSFLSEKYQDAKNLIGKVSGRDRNKVEEAGLHYTYDPDFNGSYIEESEYVFKMKKLYEIDLPIEQLTDEIKNRFYPTQDIHTMYVCEIKQYLVKE